MLDSDELEHDLDVATFEEPLRKYILQWFGNRCDEFQPDCPCCEAWRMFDTLTEKWVTTQHRPACRGGVKEMDETPTPPMMRDAQADLAVCNACPPGPYFVNARTGKICYGDPDDDADNYPVDSPEAIGLWAISRTALPYWIGEAQRADDLERRLAEVERERDEWQNDAQRAFAELDRTSTENARLTERVRTLKSLVGMVRYCHECGHCPCCGQRGTCDEDCDIAKERAAKSLREETK